MVVVDMSKVGQIVDEGTYPVVLTSVKERKLTGNKKGDIVTFGATIRESGTDWDGKPLFRNFFLSAEPDADNSATLYYLMQTLLAFGADDDEIAVSGFDPVAYAKENLMGNVAQAKVMHQPDKNDPDKIYANTAFEAPDIA